MLNITKLDYYYYNIRNLNNSSLNHIHLSMSFDKNYILLSSISIASILNTSSIYTYIHFHLILNNCSYFDIKTFPLINLKKINKNVEFIFYNGKQAEYDFGLLSKNESRGIGEFSRLLIPEIINNTNKVLILDSADILALKDLSEIYYYELNNNYFAFILDILAGNFKQKVKIFSRNKFSMNGGVVLVNVDKFKEDNLYQKSFFAARAYEYFTCPYQEILLIISNFNFKYMPLNFNTPQFYNNDEISKKQMNNTKFMNLWKKYQKFSPFRYDNNEIINAALNPIIVHLLGEQKPFLGGANKKFTIIWINYAKMIGLSKKLKKLYPKPFKMVEKIEKQKQ